MNPKRKRDLTPLDHQVCDEVAKLRKDMRLSASVFARQLGVTVRTLSRWEAHDFSPRVHYLVRIKQLKEMQDHLDSRDRDSASIDFSGELPVTSPYTIKSLHQPVMVALLEMLGGQVTIKEAEIKEYRKRRHKVTFNPQARCYTVRLRPIVKRTPPHATV